jgi:hypothetical protein
MLFMLRPLQAGAVSKKMMIYRQHHLQKQTSWRLHEMRVFIEPFDRFRTGLTVFLFALSRSARLEQEPFVLSRFYGLRQGFIVTRLALKVAPVLNKAKAMRRILRAMIMMAAVEAQPCWR